MKLDNGIICVEINDHGAEIKSIVKNGIEYMWCGDAKYWNRTAPVLFPIVGGLKDKKYTLDGKEYQMGQHGFARDMDFELVESDGVSATYILRSNAETLEKYPFEFELTIRYVLEASSVRVIWQVKNQSGRKMYFSIGAHPAFNLRDGKNYFSFDTERDLSYHLIDESGLYAGEPVYTLENKGFCEITRDMFNRDALIMEDAQAKSVSLCDANKKPYVTMTFSADVFGLWSKPDGAPFVCIEPWYGRCDRNDFQGEFSEKDHIQSLEKDGSFKAEYTMDFKGE